MKKEEAVNFVVQELGKHQSRNEVIVALCQKSGMNWVQAEQFVKQVEVDHKTTIGSRQRPLFIVMGITFIVVGCGLLIYNIQYVISLFQRDAVGLTLAATSATYRIGSMVTGLGMLIGGIIGLFRVMSDSREK